ncbi:MAG: glycosyltransferase family 4 protein [Acidobacteriota bacterium]
MNNPIAPPDAARLRVCLISFSGFPDQGATYFYEHARALATLGHEVTAYAVGRPEEPLEAIEHGVRVHRLPQPLTVDWASPARWLRKFKFLYEAGRFVRARQFDIVHVYCTIGTGVLPLIGGSKPRWVIEYQTGSVSQRIEAIRTLENRMRAWQGATFDASFALNEVLGRRLLGSRPFHVVPAGVNLSAFRPGLPRTFRAEHGIADDHIVFILAGTLDALRGTDVPLRAFAQAISSNDRLWLLMPGKGPQLEELRELARAHGISHRVWLPGYVPYAEMPRLFAASDAGVSYLAPTEYHEGLPPMKVMEYLGAGLPVIATDVSSHRMQIQHESNGLLAAPGPEGFAAAMLRFAADGELRARMAAAAAPSVAHLTWERIAVERILPVYAGLAARAR